MEKAGNAGLGCQQRGLGGQEKRTATRLGVHRRHGGGKTGSRDRRFGVQVPEQGHRRTRARRGFGQQAPMIVGRGGIDREAIRRVPLERGPCANLDQAPTGQQGPQPTEQAIRGADQQGLAGRGSTDRRWPPDGGHHHGSNLGGRRQGPRLQAATRRQHRAIETRDVDIEHDQSRGSDGYARMDDTRTPQRCEAGEGSQREGDKGRACRGRIGEADAGRGLEHAIQQPRMEHPGAINANGRGEPCKGLLATYPDLLDNAESGAIDETMVVRCLINGRPGQGRPAPRGDRVDVERRHSPDTTGSNHAKRVFGAGGTEGAAERTALGFDRDGDARVAIRRIDRRGPDDIADQARRVASQCRGARQFQESRTWQQAAAVDHMVMGQPRRQQVTRPMSGRLGRRRRGCMGRRGGGVDRVPEPLPLKRITGEVDQVAEHGRKIECLAGHVAAGHRLQIRRGADRPAG